MWATRVGQVWEGEGVVTGEEGRGGELRTGWWWFGGWGRGGQAGAALRSGRPFIITGPLKLFPATVTGWSP